MEDSAATSTEAATADTSEAASTEAAGSETSTPSAEGKANGEAKTLLSGDADAGDEQTGDVEADKPADETADAGDDPKPEDAKAGDDDAKADGEADKDADKPKDDKKADEDADTADADEEKPEDEAKADDDAKKEDDPHWRDLITDEKNKNRANRVASLDDAFEQLREYDSFKKRAVLPPNSKSTPEEIARFNKAVGVPDDPDGYGLEAGKDADEGEVNRIKRLAEAAHAVHLNPNQLTALIDWHDAEQAAVQQQEEAAHAEHQKSIQTDLSREWGPDYTKNLTIGTKFIKEMLGDQADDFLSLRLEDGTRVGDNLTLIKGAAKKGRLFTEAGVPGNVVPDNWAPTKAELDKMIADPRYRDPARRDPDFVKQVEVGFKRLYDGK